MRIKTYVFDDVKRGIEVLKKEYGPDTIIVDVKENLKGMGNDKFCEISIAIKEDTGKNDSHLDNFVKKREDAWSNLMKTTLEKIKQVESELLKDRLKMYPLPLRSFYEKMLKNGLHAYVAMDIISELFKELGELSEQTSKVSYFIKEMLHQKIKVSSITDFNNHIVILGPTGAGKTQTAKKLGVMLSALGKPVSVILYKSKEEDASEVKKNIINVITVDKKETLYHIVEKDDTKKIIDVPGRVEVQKEIMDRLKDAKSIVVFSAGSRDEKIRRYLDVYD
ncbi:MAG TPA: hypothetical protein PK800_09100, partial [Syntrophorhabdaceae bacterium]|nr:hypothetical protein [Syntrophorhabdaceae bacterium]